MSRTHPDKMSFLEHLEELRQRLVRSALALCVSTAICWTFHERIFNFMTAPLRVSGFKDPFIYTGMAEAFMLYMKMSFFLGIFLAVPYLLWEAWGFISPGLYAHEKRYVVPFILFGTLFFIAGAAFGHYFLFPSTFSFLGGFGGADMKFMPKIDEYWTFYSWFLLGLGLVFQIPVIIFVLARIGLVTPRFLLRGWKWAVVGAFVIAAFITPSPDMVNQTMLAAPMIGLYFLGVAVAAFFGKARKPEETTSGEERS
jgi:sec-independent protein translocase protein TatC